jgi:hypothetical protein
MDNSAARKKCVGRTDGRLIQWDEAVNSAGMGGSGHCFK